MPTATVTALDHGIFAIDTEYARPLQDASHLIVENGRAAFVDTGTNSSVPLLLDALEQQGLTVDDVDYVFLTHIHLDHAGGAGELMQALPGARCVVHPRGAPHMIDPSRLIAGTEAVYGKAETEALYGTILPIEADRVHEAVDGEWLQLEQRRLQLLFTEGHAKHHYVIHDPASRGVFSGDSFGVSYRETDTANGAIVFPTTTPIDFDPVEAHCSVDRIMACEPERVYLTHYSEVTELDRLAADMHRRIDDYVAMAKARESDDNRRGQLEDDMLNYMIDELQAHGVAGDRDALASVMAIDAKLNAQGLDVWLTRQAKREGRA